MARLIYFYRCAPNLTNARAIRNYLSKHPMCMCLLDSAAADDVRAAVAQANNAEPV
jgi:hypothetical protein